MTHTSTHTHEEQLGGALQTMRKVGRNSREHSLVITKLEEACLWHDRDREESGLKPLGINWYDGTGRR